MSATATLLREACQGAEAKMARDKRKGEIRDQALLDIMTLIDLNGDESLKDMSEARFDKMMRDVEAVR